MKKLMIPAMLPILAALAVVSYAQQATYQPYVVPWSNRSYRANKADSVKDGAGNYRPVTEVICGDTVAQAWRADSVKWGSGWSLLSEFLPDSFGLFLRLHAQADSARNADNADSLNHAFPDFGVDKMADSLAAKLPLHAKADSAADAITARNADSLNHKFPDFDVDKIADSLAVKAPLSNPIFTGRDSGQVAVRDTVRAPQITVGSPTAAGTLTLYDAYGAPVPIVNNGGLGGIYISAFFGAWIAGYGTDNTGSFARLKLQAYAKGTRPASPGLGDVIMIDGDTTTDSLLVYMGGTWKLLKE